MCVCTGWYTHVYVFFALSADRSDTPLARSTPSTQTLFSNTILKSKRLGLLGEMAD